jgi:hypothetical protein
MRRSFVRLASICVLPCVIPGVRLAERLANSIASTEIDVMAPVLQEAKDLATGGTQYYVDCDVASSNGDGRSPATAWHSLDAINEHSFSPGDSIYLKRGSECHGSLWPKGSGSAAVVIHLSAYGQGARPKVIAGQGAEEAFKLLDQEYWDVDSIDFGGGTLFGVFVSGNEGILHHIHLRNLLVHDVHGGEVKHKESGLVVISPGKIQQHFDDVLVEGVTAYRTEQWAGIVVGGGNFGEVAEKDWSTHVIVRNSVVHDVYGDGIILFRVKDGLIDSSAAWHTGMQPTQSIGTPNAIWTWMCTDCVVSKNEAFLTDSPGVDGGAFDIDYGNTRNSVLDSYGHDTQGYCVAVFGAGYVTHESVVKGNLCINNGKSPRMARYQGAIFLLTWNSGAIENLRVESNTVYWTPPGDFPAVLNRADLRGSQRIFRANQIYSSSPWFIDSNKELTLQGNRYISCGGNGATWVFDSRIYGKFDKFRADASQEQGSTWNFDKAGATCLGRARERLHGEEGINKPGANKDAVSTRRATQSGWRVVSEIPVSMDAQGLLDPASAGQLMILRNLYRQFRASGLRMTVTLNVHHLNIGESVQNAIRDLQMEDIKIAESPGQVQPRTQFVAPDGAIVRVWQGFVGPAEIGLTVRSMLGEPRYSQMESEIQ